MDELREQLGGLLRLEEAYATRDYLEDLVRQDHRDFSSWRIRNIERSCDETMTTEAEGDMMIQSDASLPSITSSSTCGSSDTMITEKRAVAWREKICEWSYEVVDHFELSRDLVYIALNYLDRVCAASNTMELLGDKRRFQLLAMSALCLAIKLHGGMDIRDPAVESSIVETILHLGRGQFLAEELNMMEVESLQRLQWRLNPPTPQAFLMHLLELFPVEEKEEINDIALYTIELSVHDYYLVPAKASTLAFAAICNSKQMLGHSNDWMTKTKGEIFQYDESNSIHLCQDRLHRLYANTGTKLEDIVDISSLRNSNHLDGVSGDRSPLSVIT